MDPAQYAELLNAVFRTIPEEKKTEDNGYQMIHPEWVDEEKTRFMTEVVRGMLPGNYPFFPIVIVEKSPDWKLFAESEDELKGSLRYIFVNMITDVPK